MGLIDEDNARERDIRLRPARSSGGPFPLYSHRLLHEDGGLHCYQCGAFFANPDGDEYSTETKMAAMVAMHETASAVDCTGPTTEHPGYWLGIVNGEPYRETCAAHPYAD